MWHSHSNVDSAPQIPLIATRRAGVFESKLQLSAVLLVSYTVPKWDLSTLYVQCTHVWLYGWQLRNIISRTTDA